VYGYLADENFDGLIGGEGTFSMCTFLVCQKTGQLNKARLIL